MATRMTQAQWQEKAAATRFRTQAFIDGRFVDAVSGETFDNVNPATGKVFAKVAATSAADVDRAAKTARRAFESGKWARMAPSDRKRILLKLADLIEANGDELALTESLDMGKPIRDAQRIDIPATARCFRWYGEAIACCCEASSAIALGSIDASGVARLSWSLDSAGSGRFFENRFFRESTTDMVQAFRWGT